MRKFVLLTFVFVFAAGLVSAQDTTYTGCLNNGGNINKVAIGNSPSSPCSGNQMQISWNAKGPEGPEGPQGPEGPSGDDGADGAQGPPGNDGAQGQPGADGQDGFDGEHGISCWDLNEDGACFFDGSSNDEDINDDGECTVDDCQATNAAAGQSCPPDTFVTGFDSDGNLLCSEAGPSDPLCGNGFLDPGEQCDDGDSISSNDCTNQCTASVCGDGILKTSGNLPLEQCDDGNLSNGDGCDSICQTEPSLCDTNPVCDVDFVHIGTVSGDTSSGLITRTAVGEQWFRVYVEENDSGFASSEDLLASIRLTTGPGQDYDLRTYCDGCGSVPASVGEEVSSNAEVARVRWREETGPFGVPTGSDSGRYIYIEVIQIYDDSCEPWLLTVQGDTGGTDLTCLPR